MGLERRALIIEDELEMTATEPGNAGSLPIEAGFE